MALGGAAMLLALAAAPATLPASVAQAANPAPGFGRNIKADAGRGDAGAGDNEPAITVDQSGTAWVSWQQAANVPSYVTSTADGVLFSDPVSPDPTQGITGDVAWANTTFPATGHDTPIAADGQSGLFWGVLGVGCGAIQIRVAPSADRGRSWTPGNATCQPAQVDRDWLAAMRRSGVNVAWSWRRSPPTALAVAPAPLPDPAGATRVAVAAPGGTSVALADRLGPIDTGRAASGGLTVIMPTALGSIEASGARASVTDSSESGSQSGPCLV